MSAKQVKTVPASGSEFFIPLNKLKKSPKNARKTPHSQAAIETYAASIATKGILQNLVVEPEFDADAAATGFYFVTIGEGRRLAQLLRVKRKEIKKTEPIRCIVDTANDPHEISLDENVTRENMHPADQFEAFKKLADERGFGAEEIAARFGVTAHVVRQRLRLAAVSPKLMQIYRDGDLGLDQLMAFAITEDRARQEAVFDRLSYHLDASTIRRLLTETHVPATDRRARFVGIETYTESGGTILRDLFTEDRGGYLNDVVLLDRLVVEKLRREANALREAEGWKWIETHLDFPHAHGMRRIYPHPVELSAEGQAALDKVQMEFDSLTERYQTADELPDDVDARFGELEADIERLEAKRVAYDPEDIARSGAFVILNYDGAVRIERGFVRRDDEQAGDAVSPDGGDADGAHPDDADSKSPGTDADDDNALGKPLSDLLVRDLSAHRTQALRLIVGEQPDVALLAVIHAMVAQAFYRSTVSCLDLRGGSAALASHADGIEDTDAARQLAKRHARWASQLPEDPSGLWAFIVGLDYDSRMALLAHCAGLTISALTVGWERRPFPLAHADELSLATGLDMTSYWRPTARRYFARVTKDHIVTAVREAVGPEAAERISNMKKDAMAEAAEQLVAATGWLPELLRTPVPSESRDGASVVPHVDGALAAAE